MTRPDDLLHLLTLPCLVFQPELFLDLSQLSLNVAGNLGDVVGARFSVLGVVLGVRGRLVRVSGVFRGSVHGGARAVDDVAVAPPADLVVQVSDASVADGSVARVGMLAADVGDRTASAALPGTVAAEVAVRTAAGTKVVSWAGFVFGSVMSVAANVLRTWLPVERMPPVWSPGIAAQIGLLLPVEVLSRVRWPDQ